MFSSTLAVNPKAKYYRQLVLLPSAKLAWHELNKIEILLRCHECYYVFVNQQNYLPITVSAADNSFQYIY